MRICITFIRRNVNWLIASWKERQYKKIKTKDFLEKELRSFQIELQKKKKKKKDTEKNNTSHSKSKKISQQTRQKNHLVFPIVSIFV